MPLSAGSSAAQRSGSLVWRLRCEHSATSASAFAPTQPDHSRYDASGAPSIRVTANTSGGWRRVSGMRPRIAHIAGSLATPAAQSA